MHKSINVSTVERLTRGNAKAEENSVPNQQRVCKIKSNLDSIVTVDYISFTKLRI